MPALTRRHLIAGAAATAACAAMPVAAIRGGGEDPSAQHYDIRLGAVCAPGVDQDRRQFDCDLPQSVSERGDYLRCGRVRARRAENFVPDLAEWAVAMTREDIVKLEAA